MSRDVKDYSAQLLSSAVESMPRLHFGALLALAYPAVLGLLSSGVLCLYVPELSHWLFGGPPHGSEGYLLLALVVLPFLVSMLFIEWRLAKMQLEPA